jgi:RHS repeat-associated protein
VPSYLDVTGMGPTAATVTVDGTTANRQASFFYHTKTAAGPSWVGTTISSTYGGSEVRNQFVPASPEAYTYDEDGNLLSDGRWSYTWDAENRLKSMETVPTAYNAGAPRQKLDFTYDYLGRRVQKTRSTWSGSSWVPDAITRFVYDGWNLIAEFNGSMAIQKNYTWGLDISRTLADAGGVKGLLMIRDRTTNATYVPAYDGNGNIAALINRGGNTLDAVYEFTPFGEPLRASGTYAQSNPFRFSTKYTDNETGYVYYGKRYYDPKLGRFLRRDPVGERGGVNLYAFVRNNSLNRWDYLGLSEYLGSDTMSAFGIHCHVTRIIMGCVQLITRTCDDGSTTVDVTPTPGGGV